MDKTAEKIGVRHAKPRTAHDRYGIGHGGEWKVLQLLRAYDRKVSLNRTYFDILIDGSLKVEVKTATPSQTKTWVFNIHRHGEMPTKHPDVYILRLEKIPF